MEIIVKMSKSTILHGIFFGASASLWWGIIGVFYFKSVSFAGPIELVIHRTIWTTFLLLITTTFYSKWSLIFLILKDLKKTLLLLITSILIFSNWFTWIYAVVTNKLIDASFEDIDESNLLGGELAYVNGSFTLQGEYMQSTLIGVTENKLTTGKRKSNIAFEIITRIGYFKTKRLT